MVSTQDLVLTLEEAAELMKVAPGLVERHLESGELAGRKLDGEWRTTSRAVLEFVDGLSARMACCTTADGKTVCCGPEGSCGCC